MNRNTTVIELFRPQRVRSRAACSAAAAAGVAALQQKRRSSSFHSRSISDARENHASPRS
jgi:hypothetical protein